MISNHRFMNELWWWNKNCRWKEKRSPEALCLPWWQQPLFRSLDSHRSGNAVRLWDKPVGPVLQAGYKSLAGLHLQSGGQKHPSAPPGTFICSWRTSWEQSFTLIELMLGLWLKYVMKFTVKWIWRIFVLGLIWIRDQLCCVSAL